MVCVYREAAVGGGGVGESEADEMEGGRRAQADRAEVPRGESKAGGGRGEPKGYKTRLDCGAVSLNLPSPPVVSGTFLRDCVCVVVAGET